MVRRHIHKVLIAGSIPAWTTKLKIKEKERKSYMSNTSSSCYGKKSKPQSIEPVGELDETPTVTDFGGDAKNRDLPVPLIDSLIVAIKALKLQPASDEVVTAIKAFEELLELHNKLFKK